MKANELRIGNIVAVDNYIYNIRMINKIIVSLEFANSNIDEGSCHYELLRPIELTEEWLKKLGFESYFTSDPQKLVASKGYRKGVFEVHQPIEKVEEFVFDYWCTDGALEIQYVHQLQNLYFALTGEELVINL